MNKKNILAAGLALLTLGGATATALVNLDRVRLGQPSELTKERASLVLHPERQTQLRVSRPESPIFKADEVTPLLTGFPATQNDFNSVVSYTPETSSNVSVGFDTKNMKKDGESAYTDCPSICIQMTYTKDQGDRRGETWAFIPVEIPVNKARLSLSYEMAVSNKFRGVDYGFYLTSDTNPESVVAEATKVEGYIHPNTGSASVRCEAEFTSPEPAGTYYLAIHHLGPAAGAGVNTTMWFHSINLSVTGSAAPEVGPNGEVCILHPTEAQFSDLKIIDGNEDGVVPYYHVVTSEFTGEFFDWPICYNNSDATVDADEWIITSAINLPDADVVYEASIDAMATGSFRTEAFDIRIGREPNVESMTKVIMDEPAVTNNSFETFTSRFGIPEAGEYYFAIHIKSLKSFGWRLVMRDFIVKKTDVSALIPDACSNLEAEANQKAELKATVSFNFPTHYMNGASIPADAELTATVISTTETKSMTGKAGEKTSVEIATADGTNIILVNVASPQGTGAESKVAVTCGLDAPNNPRVTVIPSEDNMSVTLTWETPTIGQHGGIVIPEDLVYNVYTFVQTESAAGWAPFIEGIKDNKVTLQSPQEVQSAYDFMVEATNAKGESEGGQESYASIVLGRPYQLPSGDPISDKMVLSGLNIEYTDGAVQWALDNPAAMGSDAACEDGCALIAVPQGYEGGSALLSTPKFCAKGTKNIRALFNVFCYEGMAYTDVIVYAYGKEPKWLKTISNQDGTGWTPVAIDLPAEYDNCPWMYFQFKVECPTVASYFILESYELYERRQKDMGLVNIVVPSYVVLGQEVPFTATVINRGYDTLALKDLNVNLKDGSTTVLESVAKLDGEETSLLPDVKAVFTGTIKVNKADYVGKDLKLTVTLPESDEDNTNNSRTMPVTVGLPAGPVITDLSGRQTEDRNHVVLEWENPYANGYVENFESYPHGLSAIWIGQWKNMDFDRQIDFTLANIELPNGGYPKAFQVLNESEIGLGGMLDVPSGNQFLSCMCAETAESDDWFISPEVVGGSKVSMEIASISTAYKEKFEIMYSTTDSDPDSFITLKSYDFSSEGWDHLEVTLPADAKYFAIHYFSTDSFGIFIDDIRYFPVNPEITVSGYNVYRNDQLYAERHSEAGYTDLGSTVGKAQSYNVSVIGKVGSEEIEYPLSNTVRIAPTSVAELESGEAVIGLRGAVQISGFEGETALIFDAAGRQVASTKLAADTKVALPAGIYLVRVAGKTAKVTVL